MSGRVRCQQLLASDLSMNRVMGKVNPVNLINLIENDRWCPVSVRVRVGVNTEGIAFFALQTS